MKKIYISIITLIFVLLLCGCDKNNYNIKSNDDLYNESVKILSKIPDNVTEDLLFPRKINGIDVNWITDNEKVINNQGKVHRQVNDVSVTITIILKYNEFSSENGKKVLVLKDDKIPTTKVIDVINGKLGYYELIGTCKAVNNNSFIIGDDTGNILVYKGIRCNLSYGDIVYIKGETVKFGKTIQFNSSTTYDVLDKSENEIEKPIKLTKEMIDNYISSDLINVEYVEVEAVIVVSNNYINFKIKESNILGTIAYPIDDTKYTNLDGKSVKLEGYVINIISNNKYLSLLCTSCKEETVTDNAKTINEILKAQLGKYEATGIVVGINKQSFILCEDEAYIMVYMTRNWKCDLSLGDKVTVNGETVMYANSKQFSASSKYEIISHNNDVNYEYQYLSDSIINYSASLKQMPIMMVEYEGVITSNNGYYNMTTSTSNVITLNAPLDEFEIDDYLGKNVKIYGLFTSINGIYINICLSKIEEIKNDELFSLHILEVNDLHGYCLQDENGKSGLSNLSYLVNKIRDDDPRDDVILIGNGDMFQGTAISNITYGKAIVEAMNLMQFDCMTIGNHEFDWKLDKVLTYFDGIKENGESSFPLLNANVYNNDGTLVTIDNGNIYESITVEREGVNVGIIGYIGNVYSSISYACRKDYYFDNDIKSSVEKIGTKLKDKGCDIIIVSIHGGDAGSIESYNNNYDLSNIKYKDDYLVDAVINGHTHTKQTGYINRKGVRLPLVQGGCNGAALGEIVLNIDMESKKVITTYSSVHDVYEADKNYDLTVEKSLQESKGNIKDVLEEKYAIATETINNKYQLIPWVANVLVSGTNADVAICNTGGLRSTGNITSGFPVTIENMYMINPFDNYLIIVEVLGSDLSRFLANTSIFTGFKKGLDESSLVYNKTYRVCVVDYVYYWDTFPKNDKAVTTNIIMRDLLIMDVKARDEFAPIMDSEAKIRDIYTN